MNEVRLHVQGLDDFFADARRMAKRIDSGDLSAGPETVAFESMELLLKTLTPNRWALLRRLRGMGPSSIRSLAFELGRDYRGVHSDVTALVNAGLIEKSAGGKVLVPWSRITAEMSIDVAA